ncbi:MAG: DHHW family protein, partial [Bacteroidales bacterium]|nr:DHHW family protein [Bacteroidales bacterium]
MKKTISLIAVLLLLAMTVETAADNRRRTRPRAVPHAKRKVGNPNILVIDSGMNTRAMELYKGAVENAVSYAHMVNSYKRAWGDRVNVYCMVIPTAVALYCPDSLRYKTNDEQATLNALYGVLDPDVEGVRLLPVLQERKAENIYSRTDHHWAPLGAFYAAKEFARRAKVDFKPLSAYDMKVVKNFVGTMYKFSGNVAVKNAPEDFVYYTPRDVSYR